MNRRWVSGRGIAECGQNIGRSRWSSKGWMWEIAILEGAYVTGNDKVQSVTLEVRR